jgi:5-oxoprolinase (ATP-hydrolysing)
MSEHLTDSMLTDDPIELELFINRFAAIAQQMGSMLERTAFSTNVRERLDFSCGLLDPDGRLVVNAPHIPVHLGALGTCVRAVRDNLTLCPGDTIITNHPGFGGSHLPDVTLITPVYFRDESSDPGPLLGYVASRAHHAELGGARPGSMPPDATTLEEEGVVFEPQHLVRGGKAQWEKIEAKLTSGRFPSRAPKENLADLQAALAANRAGAESLRLLAQRESPERVLHYKQSFQQVAARRIQSAFATFETTQGAATERLDDGALLDVKWSLEKRATDGVYTLHLDCSGSSPQHSGNLNATPAIVQSVVLYILRLLVREEMPLNEGLMRHVCIELGEETILNPQFRRNRNLLPPCEAPAVVGGNIETSQRLTDTFFKAFGLAACSQGTMNNLLFGNDRFGYYETICGGAGAGDGFHGASCVHTNMTNTRITDPEILEHRYPVRLNEFRRRDYSGGEGKWRGGDGTVRSITFLEPMEFAVLTQHRTEGPFGLNGGEAGNPGQQYLLKQKNGRVDLKPSDAGTADPSDTLVIETPGGGGYGE